MHIPEIDFVNFRACTFLFCFTGTVCSFLLLVAFYLYDNLRSEIN
jgi:hypothetical protein